MTTKYLRGLLLTVLLCVPQLVQAATTYIDPSCSTNGDGTVGEPCAASGGGVGPKNVWPTASGAGNIFLQKAGTTYLFQVSVSSGGAGNPVILSAYGVGAKPIIRSEENVANGSIKINTDARYIIIDGLNIQGQRNLTAGIQANAIRNNTTAGSQSVPVDILIQNCLIGSVVSFGASASDDGIDIRGQGVQVINNVFDDIANDAVWVGSNGSANDVVIRGNACTRVSQVGTNGDCYQYSGTSTGALIEHNTCIHTVDAKQCAVANGGAIIRYNEFHGMQGGTVNTPIYCDSGTCIIYGNITHHGNVGIKNYGTGGATFGNLVYDSRTNGIEIAATNSFVCNNTVVRPGLDAGVSAIRMTAAATNSVACNNALHNVNEGIRLTSASGQSEYNNMFHGSVVTPVYNTTTAGAIAATNAITATGQFIQEYGEGNFGLVGDSVAKRAGKWWGNQCADVRGRPCFVTPDIGAYQSGSGDPATTRTIVR